MVAQIRFCDFLTISSMFNVIDSFPKQHGCKAVYFSNTEVLYRSFSLQ